MTLLNYVLGDRAGSYLLGSALLVITLATIAAIIDIPLRGLEEDGPIREAAPPSPWPGRLFLLAGLPAALVTFLGAAALAYISSDMQLTYGPALLLVSTVNAAFALAILCCGLASPLARHWGLGLAGFGLGIAILFPLLAVILQLDFQVFGTLMKQSDRLIFAASVGGILCGIGLCVASILSMMFYVVRRSRLLIAAHRLHGRLQRGIGGAGTSSRSERRLGS